MCKDGSCIQRVRHAREMLVWMDSLEVFPSYYFATGP